MSSLLIKCRLASSLVGEAPTLDGLLEYQLSLYGAPGTVRSQGGKMDRSFPAPPQGDIAIPIQRKCVTGADGRRWEVAACSAPVLPSPDFDGVEHVAKRIGVERAGLLAERERKVVVTRNGWTKSYRLPVRIRWFPEVRWFAVGDRKSVLHILKRCTAIGKKISYGYGRVASWEIETLGPDADSPCWFAPTDAGPVLMRALPVGDYLPAGLLGARRDFGAAVPPYWHPDRYTEIVTPC